MGLYMPLFRACTTSRALTQLHARLIVTGLHKEPQASTKLIDSYAKMGSLETSRIIFGSFPAPDSFMWGVLIKNHVWNCCFQDAISLYDAMLFHLPQMGDYTFPPVLRACAAIGDLGIGQKVHGRIVKSGFESDPIVETALLNMYGELGCILYAQKLFDGMPIRDVVSWGSIISCYVHNEQPSEGLELLRGMAKEEIEIDSVTLLSAAEACGELGLWRLAKSVHAYVLRKNIQSDVTLNTSLISMYGKCGDTGSAEALFRSAVIRSIYTWTAMISSFNQNGCYREALGVFVDMQLQDSTVEPNEVTLMSALCACARSGWLKEGKSIHGFLIRNDVDADNDILRSALVDLYSNCGRLRDCLKVFNPAQDRHIVSWNMLISSYAREGMCEEALILFTQMLIEGIIPDSFTLGSVINACGDIGFIQLGSQMHCNVIKAGYSENEFVQNSLIDMYSKSGLVDSAYAIFKEIPDRGVVAWTSMMCGFHQNGKSEEAIALFSKMYSDSLEMNEVTYLTAIQACSNLGYLEKGKWIHHKLIAFGVREDMYIGTALTDMYAKCGELQMARQVFDSMTEKSVISWSAMIGGYGLHGHIDAAISLFTDMVDSGIRPNDVIFMNILSACSHAGYVNEGKSYFNAMSDFGIEPKSEHFACLVDLLSRAGDVEEAYKVINSMPFPVDASVWASLINGCRIHHRTDIIASVQEKLVDINTDDTGYYTLLSNVFAERGEWSECRTVRSKMQSAGLSKVHGYSMVVVDKRIHHMPGG
nr:putative pentatricopeptide repeat-containing protein At1g69350, mitochondrial [Ipomoea batatas]